MPRSGVIDFVDKINRLEALDQQLTTSDRVSISALTGMGALVSSDQSWKNLWCKALRK